MYVFPRVFSPLNIVASRNTKAVLQPRGQCCNMFATVDSDEGQKAVFTCRWPRESLAIHTPVGGASWRHDNLTSWLFLNPLPTREATVDSAAYFTLMRTLKSKLDNKGCWIKLGRGIKHTLAKFHLHPTLWYKVIREKQRVSRSDSHSSLLCFAGGKLRYFSQYLLT